MRWAVGRIGDEDPLVRFLAPEIGEHDRAARDHPYLQVVRHEPAANVPTTLAMGGQIDDHG